jgi:hypothetical protein
MGLLIKNTIRQLTLPNNEYWYMRFELGGYIYPTYTDCRDKTNPITDKDKMRMVLPKAIEYIEKQIVANENATEEKKNLAIKELHVIFENIKKTNSL